MKKSMKTKRTYKKFIIFGVAVYVLYIFISQQKTLNDYKTKENYYAQQISLQTEYNESLSQTKININSNEYIEKIAREKLDMYLPNERVYIDKSK